MVTKNEQAAKNHCTLQTGNDSSIPANKTIVEAGINMLVTNKSARATFTINAFPVKYKKKMNFQRNWLKSWLENNAGNVTKYENLLLVTKNDFEYFKAFLDSMNAISSTNITSTAAKKFRI